MTLQTVTAVSSYVESQVIHKPIFCQEGEFIVINLVSDEEKLLAYRLRNRIFCNELGWALQTQNGLEIDEYDKYAVFFGVLDKRGELRAFLRVLPAGRAFMIQKDFLSLVDPQHTIRKESDTVEISRLCVAPESRKNKVVGNFGVHYMSMLLFKGVYQWCLKNHARHLYAVTEQRIHKLLCLRGFPCSLIGNPYVMPDGVVAVAFIVDLREWETKHTDKSPKLFNWFSLM